jgi:hypothetical protein
LNGFHLVSALFYAFTQACVKKPPKRTLHFKDFTALPADAVAVCLQWAKNHGWEII